MHRITIATITHATTSLGAEDSTGDVCVAALKVDLGYHSDSSEGVTITSEVVMAITRMVLIPAYQLTPFDLPQGSLTAAFSQLRFPLPT